mgnify:CR=1 FL=1
MYKYCWILICLFFFQSHAQYKFDFDFHSPVGIPIVLAANFGELRSNHFHTGIDIKTNGQEGYRLYAIADGYVSRIKVSPFGYGKAIYITHPELGITSVYAHCQNFYGEIYEYVLAEQLSASFYEVELFPTPSKLIVRKGDVIAISGNTGGSTAPHLHFEIRDTRTENPLNPLLFDFFDIADSKAPEIRAIKLYAVSKYGYRIPGKEKTILTTKSATGYVISGNKTTVPAHFCSENGGVGIAVRVIDRYDAAQNVCGIYEGHLCVNGDTTYRQQMKMLDFNVNRQINTHKDYEEFKFKKLGYEKYFRTPHNKLPIYPISGNGVLGLYPGNTYQFAYATNDIKQNTSVLQFDLEVAKGDLRVENTPFDQYHKTFMYPDSIYEFKGQHYHVLFRDYLLYEPTEKIVQYENHTFTFGKEHTPLDGYYTLSLQLPPHITNVEKAVIVKENTSFGGKIVGDWITADVKELGTFKVAVDTIAPLVRNTNFVNGATITSKPLLTWSVSDDLSGLKYYGLYVNGTYVLLEYEPKIKQLFTAVKDLPSGKLELKLVAKDAVGNVTTHMYSVYK